MCYIKHSLCIISMLLISSCAELSEINSKVGDWAGNINQSINSNRQVTEDSITSKRDIDTLYVRIKREIGFATKEEAMKCNPNVDISCKWKEAAITEGGYVHERTPGVYYRMAETFGNKGQYYVDVTLEKDGKGTQIFWKVRGSKSFAAEIKADILKAIK
ncbi:TPA: hypothetical protein RNW94_001492 [Pasteurella multocida]|nr:hypothetical protein [Pasteurella multocida]